MVLGLCEHTPSFHSGPLPWGGCGGEGGKAQERGVGRSVAGPQKCVCIIVINIIITMILNII
jgi:hypothetical protein